MKYYSFLIAALLCAAVTFAQREAPVRNFPALAPAAANIHGVITEQPEGELRYYIRSGRSTWAPVYFQDVEQDGIAAQVVFSADGTKAYFKDIISHAATGTWVEGNIVGDKINVPLGQMVYWFDQYNYGMKLARVQVPDGNIQNSKYSVRGSATFTIQGNNLVLEGTSGDNTTNVYDALGLVYTAYDDQPEGEWSYYIDYNTVYTYKNVQPVVVPDNLEIEQYSLENENTGHVVNVAFDGSDVYIQGVSESSIPQAWMKGTIQGRKIVFPLQFAQPYASYLLYFCGADAKYEVDETGYGEWLYYWSDGSITFDYDQKTRTFSSKQALCVNNSDTGIDRGEIFRSPIFRPYKEKPGTPADPKVSAFIDYYFSVAGFNIVMLDVPLKDTEGNFLDPTKVSWRLFVDDDEPYTLYRDEYKYLPEDIDEVPYLFDEEQNVYFSRSYIYEKAYALYIYQSGFDRIGVQSIYRGGGEEHASKIVYYNINTTGIEDVEAGADKSVRHFDLMGRPVNAGHKGLTITRTADGSVVKRLQR